MLEEFITVKEARSVTRLGETKLYALMNEGKIQAVKIGRKTLILKSSVQAFMDALPKYGEEKSLACAAE